MIEEKLLEIEESAEGKDNYNRSESILRFREWLKQIDRRAEVIPINNTARLTNLLVSLKGEALSSDEFDLVVEIVNR
jgi:hypothetical protein